jgi:F420-non-reducing hydrogenase iron-sulfur subunit
MDNFDRKIVSFYCNWCACTGDDLTGVSRIQCPPNLRMLRLMCSGAVGRLHILETFEPEDTGAFVGGYHWNQYQ